MTTDFDRLTQNLSRTQALQSAARATAHNLLVSAQTLAKSAEYSAKLARDYANKHPRNAQALAIAKSAAYTLGQAQSAVNSAQSALDALTTEEEITTR